MQNSTMVIRIRAVVASKCRQRWGWGGETAPGRLSVPKLQPYGLFTSALRSGTDLPGSVRDGAARRDLGIREIYQRSIVSGTLKYKR